MNDDLLFQSLSRSREILSVSQLNARARGLLEEVFAQVWVEGELSNLSRPSSGHLYFTLKDSRAQIRCALFRQHAQRHRLELRDGLLLRARGRVSLYEGRGDYQLIVDSLEPAGDGALRQAFEALKARLQAEGLFDAQRKRPLPAHPQRVGIITSPSGAALRDIISVFQRRAPWIELLVMPAAVQGNDAAPQLIEALRRASSAGLDALIIGRGGGSLEDLWPFNEEAVARALAACPLPTISAVGHETDFSICDFVADLRAPTPSAAAELLSPDRQTLLRQFQLLQRQLQARMADRLAREQLRLHSLRQRLRHPGERLAQQAQRLDELELRLRRAQCQQLAAQQQRLQRLDDRLRARHPGRQLQLFEQRLQHLQQRLPRAMLQQLEKRRQRFEALLHSLHLVSPLATLGRGYSILLDQQGQAVRSAWQTRPGQRLQARLQHGQLNLRVEADTPEAPPETLPLPLSD
ncbi:exodeoxyribonuclease VII large subunit [Halopseudomonas yangmingensis]|uniref:Exodeoxyribonuclease 7 large subunit n=1 Tax=Halopseudomonas yangmingensis TaxID=1720063 RepID=A0A1I4R7P0_9GAMM|nr:exodeoxyribonuclease VII large subunit [Halopseudomonas yangmingensis]SFM48314.1 Exodeoxyribonuclease VII large subunit [Halopseudomonas yangmingensis]